MGLEMEVLNSAPKPCGRDYPPARFLNSAVPLGKKAIWLKARGLYFSLLSLIFFSRKQSTTWKGVQNLIRDIFRSLQSNALCRLWRKELQLRKSDSVMNSQALTRALALDGCRGKARGSESAWPWLLPEGWVPHPASVVIDIGWGL